MAFNEEATSFNRNSLFSGSVTLSFIPSFTSLWSTYTLYIGVVQLNKKELPSHPSIHSFGRN